MVEMCTAYSQKSLTRIAMFCRVSRTVAGLRCSSAQADVGLWTSSVRPCIQYGTGQEDNGESLGWMWCGHSDWLWPQCELPHSGLSAACPVTDQVHHKGGHFHSPVAIRQGSELGVQWHVVSSNLWWSESDVGESMLPGTVSTLEISCWAHCQTSLRCCERRQ